MGAAEEEKRAGSVCESGLKLCVPAREICKSKKEIGISFSDLYTSRRKIYILAKEVCTFLADLPISAFHSRSLAFLRFFRLNAL